MQMRREVRPIGEDRGEGECIFVARHNLKMDERKTIALIAHDNMKRELLEWAAYNREKLAQHELYATETTGRLLHRSLDLEVRTFMSGPLGGDQQIGARIAEGAIDVLIFFWDPLEPQPHDPDIRALLRIAVVWNIPVASNRATADFIISSPVMSGQYVRLLPDRERFEIPLEAGRAAD